MNEVTGYHNLSIHPGQINIWYQSLLPRRKYVPESWDPNSEGKIDLRHSSIHGDNLHHGTVSIVANRKITRAVDYLVYLVPKKKYFSTADGRAGNYFLSFVTLTLSSQQIHSDNDIKRDILEPFLNDCRKRWKVVNYIWRAERQENGNIHFHLITDRFIWWNDLRNTWNYFQERFGYVSRYRVAMQKFHANGFQIREDLKSKWSISRQYAAWLQGIRSDWNSPNSTDVHSLKSIVSVRSYITKYITKPDETAPIEGRLWGCSYGLTNISGARTFAEGSVADELDRLRLSGKAHIYTSDFYEVMFLSVEILKELHLKLLWELWTEYIDKEHPTYRQQLSFAA
jgi:hypothetical protein